MLGDLKKEDWLTILGLPAGREPQAVLLRGTRDLKAQCDLHRCYFTDAADLSSPDGLVGDVLLGEVYGVRVAYASVYGGPMASEIVHLCGLLGASLVVHTGTCRALGAEVAPGDLFLATEACCGDGPSRHYGAAQVVGATVEPSPAELGVIGGWPLATGRVYTTAARMACTQSIAERWQSDGISAVDQETAAVFAVADHFGMDRAAVLLVNDNPYRRGRALTEVPEKDERTALGNWLMIDLAFAMIKGHARR